MRLSDEQFQDLTLCPYVSILFAFENHSLFGPSASPEASAVFPFSSPSLTPFVLSASFVSSLCLTAASFLYRLTPFAVVLAAASAVVSAFLFLFGGALVIPRASSVLSLSDALVFVGGTFSGAFFVARARFGLLDAAVSVAGLRGIVEGLRNDRLCYIVSFGTELRRGVEWKSRVFTITNALQGVGEASVFLK